MPFIDLNFPTDGGPGEATVTFQAVCLSGDAIGDVVYISGNQVGPYFQVAKVDITTLNKMPAVGVIIQKLTSTTAVVMSIGEVAGLYTGLTPNSTLFVDTNFTGILISNLIFSHLAEQITLFFSLSFILQT